MKKIFVLFLAALLMVSFVGSAFAEEVPVEGLERPQVRFNVLKEFNDELHQLNALRIERHSLKIDIIEEQDAILDLYIAAREAGEREALQAAKDLKAQIKDLNLELKEIREQSREARKAFREEVKSGNLEAARGYVNDLIDLMTLANSKVKAKVDILKQIKDVLS